MASHYVVNYYGQIYGTFADVDASNLWAHTYLGPDAKYTVEFIQEVNNVTQTSLSCAAAS